MARSDHNHDTIYLNAASEAALGEMVVEDSRPGQPVLGLEGIEHQYPALPGLTAVVEETGDGIDWYAARSGEVRRFADLDDQVEAARRIFASDTRWTVVRGSDLEEGESQGLPVWSRHVGDPILASNRTRRVDFALFMVEALVNDELIHEAPAIVGCGTPSALAHAAVVGPGHDR